jgi:glutathione S-transferase
MAKVDGALDALEGDSGLSDGFTLGHAATGCALGYLDLRFPEKDWRNGRPELSAWYEGFQQRASAKATEPSA